MSLSTSFDYQAARQWKAAVERLNEETDQVLKNVAAALQEIGDGCEGAIVQDLVQIAQNMAQKFKELVNALKELVVAVVNVIQKLLDFEDTVKEGIKDAASAVLGGLLG